MDCSVPSKIIQKKSVLFFLLICLVAPCHAMNSCKTQEDSAAFLYEFYGISPLIVFPLEIKKQIFSQLFPSPLYEEHSQFSIDDYKKSWIYSASFAPDRKCIAIGTNDGTLFIDIAKKSLMDTAKNRLHGNSTALLFDNETNSLIVGTDEQYIDEYTIDKTTGKWDRKNFISADYTLPVGEERYRAIYYMTLTLEKNILFGTEWGNILLLDRTTKSAKKLFDHQESTSLNSICFRSDELVAACAHESGKIEMVDLTTNRLETFIEDNPLRIVKAYQGLCFSPDNTRLLVLFQSGIALFETKTKQILTVYENTQYPVFAHFSTSGELVVVGDNARSIRIFNSTTNSCIATLPIKHEIKAPFGGCFNGEGDLLAIRTSKILSIWKLNPLAAYLLLNFEVKTEQLLFIKFLIDITNPTVCKKGLEKSEFFIKHSAKLKNIFYSFDEKVQDYIRQRFLMPHDIDHLL
ncbi:hypothetical protein H0X06_02180 [Candidatus Dependentiae bacterium]|nr:hypothetical protein [Candidatus Dependentiae bacterium]